MTSERFFKTYKVILFVVLILMLIPILIACFFARPVTDDLVAPVEAAHAWRDTGSLVAMLKAGLQTIEQLYFTHSGTFTSMIISTFPLSVFGARWIGLNAVITIGLILWSMWHVAKCLKVVCKEIKDDVIICAWLLMSLMILLFMPSYYEGIYWSCGAGNYTNAPMVMFILFASMFCKCYENRASVWNVVLWSIGFFFLGGVNWVSPTSAIVAGGAVVIWVFGGKKSKCFLIPFAFLLLGYMIAIISPSNVIRQELMNVDTPIYVAFFNSFLQSFLFLFKDARYWLFMLFLIPVFVEAYRYADLKYRSILWLPTISICILAATMFPVLYRCTYWAERHTNACFFTLAVLLPVNLFYCAGWIFCRLGTETAVVRCSRFVGKDFVAAGIVVLGLIGVLSVPDMTLVPFRFSCTLQPVKVVSHLLDGQIPRFAQEYDALVEYVKNHPGEEIIVRSPFQEEILNAPWMITGDPNDWRNLSFCEYYGNDNTIDYVPWGSEN